MFINFYSFFRKQFKSSMAENNSFQLDATNFIYINMRDDEKDEYEAEIEKLKAELEQARQFEKMYKKSEEDNKILKKMINVYKSAGKELKRVADQNKRIRASYIKLAKRYYSDEKKSNSASILKDQKQK